MIFQSECRNTMHLGDQQPKHYDQGNKQEESGEKLFIHVLRRSRGSCVER